MITWRFTRRITAWAAMAPCPIGSVSGDGERSSVRSAPRLERRLEAIHDLLRIGILGG